MEYNNYYPAQVGHPPPPPPPVTNQHGSPQLQQQQQPLQGGGQMMHTSMVPQQNIRQAMPPGLSNHHQQQQQQQHLAHHSQQIPPQQQQHPNYHPIQPHSHGPTVTHSGSHHPHQPSHHSQQQQQTLTGPSPQQSALASQQQHHHMHSQSPHHHVNPPVHMHMQQQQQQMSQMLRPPMGSAIGINANLQQQQQQQPHHQNFFSSAPISQPNPQQHYQQQNQHLLHHHHQPTHPHHHHPQQQPPPQIMHHHPPSIVSHHHPHHIQQSGLGRNSPYYPSILQTEFRVIELNRRLHCRPIPRFPISPLPTYDESLWWERFASEFFDDDATLTIRTHDDKPVDYTIGRTLIPRFFRTYFDGGVTDLSINLRNPKEACLHPQLITLECDQAFIITNNSFRHPALATNQGVIVHTEGHLILDFVNGNFDTLSIKSWKFFTKGCREYIDRSMTAMGLPNSYLVEPITRFGLTKSTITYLKMCMIMEPMQDLMFQHRSNKMDPRSCLRKFLFDRYKFRCGDDNRVVTNKRRKRKPSAAPAITGAATNKRSKANINNSIVANNSGLSNNIMLSPSGTPTFSLASQDVMVVGEPSMMGGDFGDDNERMITRLENNHYDPTASTPSNAEEGLSMNTLTGIDNGLSNINNIESSMENHTLSPSLLQQKQQLQVPVQVMSQSNQLEQSSPQGLDHQQQHQPHQQSQQQQHLHMNVQDESSQINQVNLIDHNDMQQHETISQMLQLPINDQTHIRPDQLNDEDLIREDVKLQENKEETKIGSIVENVNESNMLITVESVEHLENHSNSIQPLNEESNSNSQLPCTTASTTSSLEQQQPVDNGVA